MTSSGVLARCSRSAASTSRASRLSAVVALSSVIACTHISKATSLVIGTSCTRLIWWSGVTYARRCLALGGHGAATCSKLRIRLSNIPLTHLIVLILSARISVMCTCHAAHRSTKERSVVRIRPTYRALLLVVVVVVIAKECVCLLLVRRLTRLLLGRMALRLDSSIIQLSILLTILVLLLHYCLLRLVIELHEETLRVIGSQLLPNEEAFTSIETRF